MIEEDHSCSQFDSDPRLFNLSHSPNSYGGKKDLLSESLLYIDFSDELHPKWVLCSVMRKFEVAALARVSTLNCSLITWLSFAFFGKEKNMYANVDERFSNGSANCVRGSAFGGCPEVVKHATQLLVRTFARSAPQKLEVWRYGRQDVVPNCGALLDQYSRHSIVQLCSRTPDNSHNDSTNFPIEVGDRSSCDALRNRGYSDTRTLTLDEGFQFLDTALNVFLSCFLRPSCGIIRRVILSANPRARSIRINFGLELVGTRLIFGLASIIIRSRLILIINDNNVDVSFTGAVLNGSEVLSIQIIIPNLGGIQHAVMKTKAIVMIAGGIMRAIVKRVMKTNGTMESGRSSTIIIMSVRLVRDMMAKIGPESNLLVLAALIQVDVIIVQFI